MTTNNIDADLAAMRRELNRMYAADMAKLRAELEKVRGQLTAANHHADGLTAGLRSAQQANTVYANENARLRQQLARSRNWFPARNKPSGQKLCSVEGCTDKHLALGYCIKHHARFKRTGDPLGVKQGSHEARLKNDVCGTLAGYSRHRKRREKPCEPCRQANIAYQRERRSRIKAEVAR